MYFWFRRKISFGAILYPHTGHRVRNSSVLRSVGRRLMSRIHVAAGHRKRVQSSLNLWRILTVEYRGRLVGAGRANLQALSSFSKATKTSCRRLKISAESTHPVRQWRSKSDLSSKGIRAKPSFTPVLARSPSNAWTIRAAE